MELEGETVYLRFGEVPDTGRSRRGLSGREAGVSAFSARRLGPGKYRVYTTTNHLASDLVSAVKLNTRVYELEGEEIGRGISEEPLVSITEKRRINPPIELEPEGYEEVIEYVFDNFLEIARRAYGGGEPKPNTSASQQVTRLASHAIGKAGKGSGKKAKKRKRKSSRKK